MNPFKLSQFINKGHERSVKAKKNIILSFIFQGVGILLGIYLVPISLEYLDPERYGIWLTVGSVANWFVFLDLGLGNGFRNKFAEAKAVNDERLARVYVSTTYGIISIISIGLLVIFLIVYPFIDWVKIFNTKAEMRSELNMLVIIVFSGFCLRLVAQLIATLTTADQKPAIRRFIKFFSKFIAVVIIIVLSKYTIGSLVNFGLAFTYTPILIFAIVAVIYFRRNYRNYLPSIKFIELKYAKTLMSMGIKFFIIEMSAVVLYSTDNMIIAQLFGPEDVTPYNIAHRYFGTIFLFFEIIISPMWSAITDAFVKKEYKWIKNSMRKLILIWIVFTIFIVIMLIISQPVYKLWVGSKVTITNQLSIFMAIYFCFKCFNIIFSSFINGVGKIKMQLYAASAGAVLNIPLSIFFAKYLNMGISGVIFATIITEVGIAAFYGPIQYYKVINNKAKGIWNK